MEFWESEQQATYSSILGCLFYCVLAQLGRSGHAYYFSSCIPVYTNCPWNFIAFTVLTALCMHVKPPVHLCVQWTVVLGMYIDIRTDVDGLILYTTARYTPATYLTGVALYS